MFLFCVGFLSFFFCKGRQPHHYKGSPKSDVSMGGGKRQRIWTIFNGWTKWKSWKFSLSRNARIHVSRHRAGDRCHAMPWRQQSRTAQASGARMTPQQKNQQLQSRTSLTSRAHCGSLSKRRELVLSSLPTPSFFPPISGPRSLKLSI